MLVGASGNKTASRMLFFTGSRYTEQVRRYADEMDIALIHYKLVGGMEAVNKPAAGLLKGKDRTARNQSNGVPIGAKKKPFQYRVTHPFTHAAGWWLSPSQHYCSSCSSLCRGIRSTCLWHPFSACCVG
jgi:hypothetical protein